MDSQEAKALVKQHTSVLREWVSAHCGKEDHLIPLALLYVHQRLSEHDWQKIRKYDGKQPFTVFFRKPVEEVLETFSHGIWFGECAGTIRFWLDRFGIHSDHMRQDVEDYVKNQLTRDNFARFRSYNKDKAVRFTTYISGIVRNLLVDYLRKKRPPLSSSVDPESHAYETVKINRKNVPANTTESHRELYLKEIGQWFFTEKTPLGDRAPPASPNVPDKMKLSPKERLFLRAIYKDGLTTEEAGSLPGINLGKWQAHNLHRRLKVRIKKLLKVMGYESLQCLLYAN